jgi:hypothetical protein
MVLDAVIRHKDHSSATFHSWRNKSPLKHLLKEKSSKLPALGQLILETRNSGITVDFEKLLSELVVIWSRKDEKQFDLEDTRRLVSGYFPTGQKIRGHENMAIIFDTARNYVDKS